MSALRILVRTSWTSVTAVRSLRKDLDSAAALPGVDGTGEATGEPTRTSMEADCLSVGFGPGEASHVRMRFSHVATV